MSSLLSKNAHVNACCFYGVLFDGYKDFFTLKRDADYNREIFESFSQAINSYDYRNRKGETKGEDDTDVYFKGIMR
jgi:hypothetical protein